MPLQPCQSGTRIDRRTPWWGMGWLLVDGPMMVRDWRRRAKVIRMAHVKDRSSLINHAEGHPSRFAPRGVAWAGRSVGWPT
jgi:hypothetical protein